MKIEHFTDTKGIKCIEVYRDNYEKRRRFNGYKLRFSENRPFMAGKREVYSCTMNEKDYQNDQAS